MATLEEAVRSKLEHEFRDAGAIRPDDAQYVIDREVTQCINRMRNADFLALLSSVLPDVEDT